MTPESQISSHPVVRDDEYKEAIQSVIDDNMRTDILGPGLCKVLNEHIPATQKLKEMMADAIEKEPSVKNAIGSVVKELDTQRKGKWFDRALGAIGTLVIGALAAIITRLI